MKKKLNFYIALTKYFQFKIIKFFIGLLGLTFGFSNCVSAQYGVWFEEVNLKGKIMSIEDSIGIPNIKVNETLTDNEGNFALIQEGPFGIISVLIEDIDGMENGKYLPIDTAFNLMDTLDLNIYIKKEPTIEEFLSENPQIPIEYKGEKIEYVEFIYILNNQLTIKTDEDFKDVFNLNNNNLSAYFHYSGTNIKTELKNKYNSLIIDKRDFDKNTLEFQIDEKLFIIDKNSEYYIGYIVICI